MYPQGEPIGEFLLESRWQGRGRLQGGLQAEEEGFSDTQQARHQEDPHWETPRASAGNFFK